MRVDCYFVSLMRCLPAEPNGPIFKHECQESGVNWRQEIHVAVVVRAVIKLGFIYVRHTVQFGHSEARAVVVVVDGEDAVLAHGTQRKVEGRAAFGASLSNAMLCFSHTVAA